MITTAIAESAATTIIAADYIAPTINWSVDPSLQDSLRKLAFVLAGVWIVWILAKSALPGRGGGMGGATSLSPGKVAGFGVLIIVLLDLNMLQKFINWTLQGAWWIGSLFGLV